MNGVAGPRAATRILGIDPGSRLTGYAVVELRSGRVTNVAHDVIRLGDGELPGRLLALQRALRALIETHRPDEAAMEQVFVRRNVASALVLGEARGAALCAIAEAGLPFHEYAPASIKLAVVGSGRAEKPQIQQMVRVLLNLPRAPQADAADALACALCHAHSRAVTAQTQRMLKTLHGARR